MEQQLSAGLTERQITQFVDDDEVVAQQLFGQPAAATCGFLLLQLIDQIDEVEEASPGAVADDRRGYGDAEMGFAGAGAANEDGIALGIQEGASGEFTNLPLIDRCIGEGERVDIFQDRELGSADAVADRALPPDRARRLRGQRLRRRD